jgi:hypothetical protein
MYFVVTITFLNNHQQLFSMFNVLVMKGAKNHDKCNKRTAVVNTTAVLFNLAEFI